MANVSDFVKPGSLHRDANVPDPGPYTAVMVPRIYQAPRLRRARRRALDALAAVHALPPRRGLERLPVVGNWLFRRRLVASIRRAA